MRSIIYDKEGTAKANHGLGRAEQLVRRCRLLIANVIVLDRILTPHVLVRAGTFCHGNVAETHSVLRVRQQWLDII